MGIIRTIIDKTVHANLLNGLKEHMRLTSAEFDVNLDILLSAAIEFAENETGCIFIASDFTITDNTKLLEIGGFYPISQVVSATYNSETIDPSDLNVSGGSIVAEFDEAGDIEIKIKAGYSEVPAMVKAAIFLIAASLFNNPGDRVEILQKASGNLLRNLRRWQM